MSKKSLDLDYMKDAIKVRSGVKAGAAALYMIPPYWYVLYGIDPADRDLE